MSSWKKKAEVCSEQLTLDRERELEQIKAEEEKQESEERKKLHEERLAHLATFACRICGKKAKKPLKGCEGGMTAASFFEVTDWDLPGDLKRCSKCFQWACDNHIHHKICQTCAEEF